MMHVLRRAWLDFVDPILYGPKRRQVAALCYRVCDHGTEVLLITSRDTGRWIIPKGWPMDGRTNAQAALEEAWEEAGVKDARINETAIGSFDYIKRRKRLGNIPVKAEVFLAEVQNLSPTYPERDERERAWFLKAEAADLVEEIELKALITAL